MTRLVSPATGEVRDGHKKIVLFHRDFRKFTGGHLKIWHYFNHVLSSPAHEPRIAFTSESNWDAINPWIRARSHVIDWNPQHADVLFLAGGDWRALTQIEARNFARPIINLIQHPRHADPKDELYGFLENRAVRICVSDQVADAIKGTGKVNGPVFVIPNGIELGSTPAPNPEDKRTVDVLICGVKAPDMAREVEKVLAMEKVKVSCLIDWIPRNEYLARLSNAAVVLTLPRPIEGFYLPALEAMACGAIVICPDCVGNRDFCLERINCFRPRYDVAEIAASALAAVRQSPAERAKMRANAQATVRAHSLERERMDFLRILGRVDELWNGGRSSRGA
jgi:hypothetical protein